MKTIKQCENINFHVGSQVRRILQLPPSSGGQNVEPAVKELQEALTAYLRRATETFDLSKNVEVDCLFTADSPPPSFPNFSHLGLDVNIGGMVEIVLCVPYL